MEAQSTDTLADTQNLNHMRSNHNTMFGSPIGPRPQTTSSQGRARTPRPPGTYGRTRKEQFRKFLDDPSSSRKAFWCAIILALLIILSSVGAIVETVPQYYRTNQREWFIFESIIVAIFSVELALRTYAHSTTWHQMYRFIKSFYTVVDIVSIAPYYLTTFYLGDSWADIQRFAVFRLFRIIRLVQCFNVSSIFRLSMDVLMLALSKSVEPLIALFMVLSFVLVSFSTLIYFAERGQWDPDQRSFIDITGHPSQFSSIPATFWFVAEVMTTVGLGDIVPKTIFGRILSAHLMLFSLLIIALPSIIIGRNFSESWAWLRSRRIAGIQSVSENNLHPPSATLAGDEYAQRSTNPIPSTIQVLMDRSQRSEEVAKEVFLANLSSTQIPRSQTARPSNTPTTLTGNIPASNIEEHGEIDLALLQELQRQNELLQKLMFARGLHEDDYEGRAREGSSPSIFDETATEYST